MRILITLLLVLHLPITAYSSSSIPSLTGYLEFPSNADYWEISADDRDLLTTLHTPVDIELFDFPSDKFSPKIIAENIHVLKQTHFTYAIYPSINVYETHPGWVRVKTIDEQLFWMRLEQPENYETIYHLLHAEWYIDFDHIEMLRVGPNQDQSEISNTDKFGPSFALRGFKYVNGDLWLQLERDRPGVMVNNMAEETNFDSSPHIGWLKAHADDGELAFRYINPC